ncbi:hypothetical protein TgHK011_007465 [Trichoderma gracile]|nr:hypothetical protein TgHK011_007465 [Trichoderma gracile]
MKQRPASQFSHNGSNGRNRPINLLQAIQDVAERVGEEWRLVVVIMPSTILDLDLDLDLPLVPRPRYVLLALGVPP